MFGQRKTVCDQFHGHESRHLEHTNQGITPSIQKSYTHKQKLINVSG